MKRWGLAAALAASASVAHAGDKPLFAPMPAWVKPAPDIDTAKIGDDAPVLLLIDNQQKLENGGVTIYFDTAARASSSEVLGSIGTIQIPWSPDHGDLTVHRAEIIRGGEHIDLLKTGKFTVLRREQQLDKRVLDGVLTATMQAEGLRVGDVLRVTASITLKDEVLKGNVQSAAPILADPVRVRFARVRLLWPETAAINWRAYPEGLTPQTRTEGGYREIEFTLPAPKQPELPNDVPGRFRPLPLVDVTSFANWEQISSVMAPLYETKGLIAPGSPLAAEVAGIMKAEVDPLKRTAAALRLVQDKLRYQLMGMGTGNYVPQTPAESWTLRYGDCKAKTLLLLAILREMGIEAEPVLANLSGLGDALAKRLPSAAAFDHVFVRAVVGGETLWLDGTGSGTRMDDIRDVPSLGFVLPIRSGGATLMPLPHRAPARPSIEARIDLDQSAGVELPASFKMSLVMRGALANQLRLITAQAGKDQVDQVAQKLVGAQVSDATVVSYSFKFDDAAATATLAATGIGYPDWNKRDGRLKIDQAALFSGIQFNPDRARTAWRDLPVWLGTADQSYVEQRLRLPAKGAGFTIEGGGDASAAAGPYRGERSAELAGEWVTVRSRVKNDGSEVAATDIAAVRKSFAEADNKPLRVAAPADYPPFHEAVAIARRTGALKPVIDGYSARIAAEPDKADRYTDRAWLYERIYARTEAIADLTKALALEASAETYLKRGQLYAATGDFVKAKADAIAARQIDPASLGALGLLAQATAELGDRKAAIALLQERIDQGGDKVAELLISRSQLEADNGDKDAAVATADKALADSPRKPALLNNRCWIKALLAVGLDTALKDCTRAIELSDDAAAYLDSRALVYFRLERFDDALADLDAALTADPDLAASLYVRGLVRRRMGDAKNGDQDIAAAQMIAPRVAELYKRHGILP